MHFCLWTNVRVLSNYELLFDPRYEKIRLYDKEFACPCATFLSDRYNYSFCSDNFSVKVLIAITSLVHAVHTLV